VTVRELIEKLQGLNPDARVVLVVDYSTYETEEIGECAPHIHSLRGDYDEVLIT
jgi:hypothetical protein